MGVDDPRNPDDGDPNDSATELAARIADGSMIDWPEGADQATHLDPARVEQLKAIAAIADLRRVTADDGLGTGAARTWGSLAIVGRIGAGQFGEVFRAWDTKLQREVALKILKRPDSQDPLAPSRAIEEARHLARVRHPNVLTVYGAEQIGDRTGIWTELIEGQTLELLITKQGPLPEREVVAIGVDLSRALAAVHAAGIVHRDVKAQNVMREVGGRVVLMDFGTGINLSSGTKRPRDLSGTPLYLAPEIFAGSAPNTSTDLYALSVLLFHLLTGDYPVQGATLDEVRTNHESGSRRRLKDLAPTVSQAVALLIDRGLDPEPERRHHTANDLERELLAAARPTQTPPGFPLPVRRVVSLRRVAGVVAVIALSLGLWSYMSREHSLPPPLTIVIADFDNRTGDPAFDLKIEPTLRRALEGAGFIAAFDRLGMRRTVGAALPEKLDETAAHELAVKHGLAVVLSGAIARQGRGFEVSMKATQAATSRVVADVRAPAGSSDHVIAVATTLIRSVREALGDRTTGSDPIFAEPGLLAKPVEVTRSFGAAIEALSRNRTDEARQLLAKVNELDPTFGPGYLMLTSALLNSNNWKDAQASLLVALGGVDSMTDRERLTARSLFSRLKADFRQCVRDYGELVARYPADVVGRNQLALCASGLRDYTRARDEMQVVVQIVPNRDLHRINLALYANYVGDFETGERQARKAQELAPAGGPYAFLALGFSQMGQNLPAEALKTFAALATVKGGATWSASGLGDLAIYEGRYADAIRIAEQGAAADLAEKRTDSAAAKFAQQAYAQLLRGQKAAAVAAAEKAVATSSTMTVRLLAGRILVEAGQQAKAQPLIEEFVDVAPEPQAFARIIKGLIALNGSDSRSAIRLLSEANALVNTWIGHYDLGRAYFAAGQYQQAESEFALCLERRGEALSLYLYEEPTFGYLPQVYYQLGRTREALGRDSADQYRTYLAIREKAGEDPLLADLRARLR